MNHLASASSAISLGTVAATTAVITSSPLLVSAGGAALGVTSFAGKAGLNRRYNLPALRIDAGDCAIALVGGSIQRGWC